jgi:(S)-2-hydroxyglutarate dehydrogenase
VWQTSSCKSNEREIYELDKLFERGIENGLVKNTIIEKDRIKDFEPNLRGVKAIHVPYTGIIDYALFVIN